MAITILLTLIVGFIDIVITSHYRLYFFYIIPLIMSSFYVNVRYSVFLCCVSVCFIITSNIIDHGFSQVHLFWNAGMMLVIFLAIIYLTNMLSKMKFIESEKKFIQEKNEMLLVSLREKETLIRETHHRMKNQLAMLGSLIKLSAGGDSDALIRKLSDRIQTFSVLYEKLTYSQDTGLRIRLYDYIEEIVGLIFLNHDVPRDSITCAIAGGDFYIKAKSASLLGLIINELVTNSIKHAFGEDADTVKRIDIDISCGDRDLLIAYGDTGPGFDYHNARSREGHIGFLLVESLTKQLGGVVRYEGGQGSRFIFQFADAGGIIGGD